MSINRLHRSGGLALRACAIWARTSPDWRSASRLPWPPRRTTCCRARACPSRHGRSPEACRRHECAARDRPPRRAAPKSLKRSAAARARSPLPQPSQPSTRQAVKSRVGVQPAARQQAAAAARPQQPRAAK